MVCTACGAQMPDSAGFCPACGLAVAGIQPDLVMTVGMNDRLLAVLAYFTLIPALVLLFVDPYRKNRYIRFHAFQCLFLCAELVVLCVALGLVLYVLRPIPFLGHLLALVTWPVLVIGCFILWLVLLLKAYQGEIFKLPLIGDWAERQANFGVVNPAESLEAPEHRA